jgi:hypothetical protein
MLYCPFALLLAKFCFVNVSLGSKLKMGQQGAPMKEASRSTTGCARGTLTSPRPKC